jgi:hypothetical protein
LFAFRLAAISEALYYSTVFSTAPAKLNFFVLALSAYRCLWPLSVSTEALDYHTHFLGSGMFMKDFLTK